jgi:hypothetical protein
MWGGAVREPGRMMKGLRATGTTPFRVFSSRRFQAPQMAARLWLSRVGSSGSGPSSSAGSALRGPFCQ